MLQLKQMQYGECNIFSDSATIQQCKFNNFNTGTVNAIQKKLVKLHEMGEQKIAFINTITVNLFLLQLLFACNPALYLNIGKSYYDMHHSPPHVSVIKGNILITM